jgi:hypothetical protein
VSEKTVDSSIDPNSVRKTVSVDEATGVVYSGCSPAGHDLRPLTLRFGEQVKNLGPVHALSPRTG